MLHEIAKSTDGVPRSTGLLETHLKTLRDVIGPRRHFFHNRERMNRLLILVALAGNHHNVESVYARIIREHLESNGG